LPDAIAPPDVPADAPAADAFVAVHGLSVVYGEGHDAVVAIEALDLSFARGDFVCVVGPSGCGKTTLLQVLAGFLSASTGTALIEGRPIRGPGPDRGVVFQQPALFPWKTVRANAAFGPMVRGVGRAEGKELAEHWLRLVGLWEFRDRYPYELSGGMQQRLAIARALANEPKLLLMDEPFGALDALTRERMQEELHAVWKRTGMTVLFITHGVEEAVYLGTSVVAMSPRPGRIIGRLNPPFARVAGERDSRQVKASPEFVRMREEALRWIWQQ
jgi:ABC-type taurine transport system ATPase subunit